MSALTSLSDELSAAVDAASAHVVAVHARRGRPASGVVWRDGVIVTADHVVDRDDDLTVVLPGGSQVDATLAGRDPSTDVAVLKASTGGATIARRADADGLRIGHLVLAIGRSGEGSASASLGVLSALDGPWTTWRGGRVDRFIRADLSAYPGFSGGPLVDASGAVVGVNTSGLSRHWSLTLPSSTVDRVTEALLSKGRIARGYLGVGLQSVRIPEHNARSLGLERSGGAIVVAVESGSPAEKSGLLIGDVLVSLDGAPIVDVEDIHGLLGPERVGKTVTLKIIRAGALSESSVAVGERPDADE